MIVLISNTSHDQKSHVVSHFNHPTLRNAIILFMILSVSHIADASAKSITAKNVIAPHFDYIDLTNAMVPLDDGMTRKSFQ